MIDTDKVCLQDAISCTQMCLFPAKKTIHVNIAWIRDGNVCSGEKLQCLIQFFCSRKDAYKFTSPRFYEVLLRTTDLEYRVQ